MDRRKFLKVSLAVPTVAMPAVWTSRSAFAQDATYPAKAIRYIVPYPPGGPADLTARIEADYFGRKFGQQIIVDNIGGGLGLPAGRALVNAPADGYTIDFGVNSHMLLAPILTPDQDFSVWKQALPIALTWSQPNLLIVAKKYFKSAAEVIERAKNSREPLTFSTSGVNSTQHMSGELFAKAAGINLRHVPYPGAAQYYPDLLEGRINMAFGTPATVMQNSETMAAVVTFASKRFAASPDTPTSGELGLKNTDVPSWGSIMMKVGTPEAIADKVDAACREMFDDKFNRDRKAALGVAPEYVGRADFVKRLDEERKLLVDLVARAGLKPEPAK